MTPIDPNSLISRKSQLLALASLCLATACGPIARGAVNVGEVQIGGFFSQGYLVSTNNNYPVDTKDGTTDFREMGFSASMNVGSHLRFAAQIYAETIGIFGKDKAILDWAMIDYNFSPEIGLRAGRLKYPRSLESDVLDLDVVRPFVLLPQSLYDVRLRDFQASFDGGSVYGTLTAGQSSFDYKVFYGEIPLHADSGLGGFFNNSGLFADPPGVQSVSTDSVYGVSLLWNTPVTGLRAGLTYSRIKNLMASGPMMALPSFSATLNLEKLEYKGVSLEYTKNAWTFTSEYLLLASETLVTLPAFVAAPSPGVYDTKSFYVSVARRLGTKFEVGVYYDHSNLGYPTPGTAPGAPINRREDWTLALRYDFSDHLLFKIEGHLIRGTKDIFNIPGIENPTSELKDSMTLIAAKTTLSF